MSAMNPLFDDKLLKAGETAMRLIPIEGRDAYLVEIVFPLDSLRVFTSKWANPMRVALEAAERAVNELKCECYNRELCSDKPYLKPDVPRETLNDEEKA